MKLFSLFWVFAVLLTQFHFGLSTLSFLYSRKPILTYLVQSKIGKIKAGIAGIANFASLGQANFAGSGDYDVEHIHHYHIEPIPVAVVAVPFGAHQNLLHNQHLAHKSGLYSEPLGQHYSYAWGSHSQYSY